MDQVEKAVIYARKSTEDKEKQVASISDQLHEAKKILDQNGLVPIKTFSEEKTGKESGVRTAFYEMLDFIEKGNANTIVCFKADRLSRNGSDGGRIIELVDKGIIKKIITPFSIFDCNNSYMLWIEFMGSTKYSKDLSDTVKRRLKIKCEMGVRPGQVPIGYLNTPNETKGQRRIIVDELRFPLVRKWWELMLSGNYTVTSSLEVVTNMGLRDRKGNKVSYYSADRMFRNIFFAGIFDYGGIRYKGSYKPVVSMREFLAVQRIIDQTGRHGRTDTRLPFQGKMKCGECGSTITGEKHHRGRKTFWYYRCKKNKGKCSQPYMNADDMNAQVKDYIREYNLEPEFCEWLRGVLRRRNTFEFEVAKKEKELITKQLKDLDAKKEVVCKMRIDGLLDESEYKAKVNELLTEERSLQESESYNRTSYWTEILNRAINFSEQLIRLYERKDVFIRQQILNILGRTVYVKDKKVYIEAKNVFVGLKKAEKAYFGKNEAVEQQIVPSLWPNADLATQKINSVPRV